VRAWLHELYEGRTRRAHAFRYGLLAFDLATLTFLVASSFFHGTQTQGLEIAIGLVILLDVAARLWISRQPLKDLVHPYGIADIVVVISLLAPLVGEGLAFLRIMRTLRLVRSYQMLSRLRRDVPAVRRNEALIASVLNLAVFIFVTTAIVLETQYGSNPGIGNYADALYFTVTTLTTTGFGDITLPGTGGRILSVLIMIFGVSLFLRLIRVIFRPDKVEYECADCGLDRHEPDAVHCKHCGQVLHIQTHGAG